MSSIVPRLMSSIAPRSMNCPGSGSTSRNAPKLMNCPGSGSKSWNAPNLMNWNGSTMNSSGPMTNCFYGLSWNLSSRTVRGWEMVMDSGLAMATRSGSATHLDSSRVTGLA